MEIRIEEVSNPSALPIDSDDLLEAQLRLNYRQRKSFAPDFATRVNQQASLFGVDMPALGLGAQFAGALRDVGFARLGPLLSTAAVRDVLDHFAAHPCFNAHVMAQSDRVGGTPDELASRAHFGSYRQEDVITAPHVLELANDPRILSAVADYLGCVPSLYSMNAWWSFPRPVVGEVVTQRFHRDGDDFKNCVLFLYLTDTDSDGCHQYIRGSHRPELLRQVLGGKGGFTVEMPDGEKLAISENLDELFDGTGYGRDDVYRTLFDSQIESIEGAAGDGFLTDPDGLHRATHPMHKRRLIVWLRYGMHRNCAYVRDLLQPVPASAVGGRLPDTATARFVNRLVVSPN